MKRSLFVLSISLLMLFIYSFNVSAQSWETFEASDFNIKISIPSNWKTSTGNEDGIPYLEATSSDQSMFLFIFVYKDITISTEELLNNAINDLGISIEGEAANENLNGMDAWVAETVGIIDDMEVGLYITAATYDENNYVAYIFTPIEFFYKNSQVMNKIIDSLSPMKK